MTAAKVIEEMDSLPPDEQAKVIQHALELARHRQLGADELGELAERLATSNDPAEIIRFKGHPIKPTLSQLYCSPKTLAVLGPQGMVCVL